MPFIPYWPEPTTNIFQVRYAIGSVNHRCKFIKILPAPFSFPPTQGKCTVVLVMQCTVCNIPSQNCFHKCLKLLQYLHVTFLPAVARLKLVSLAMFAKQAAHTLCAGNCNVLAAMCCSSIRSATTNMHYKAWLLI